MNALTAFVCRLSYRWFATWRRRLDDAIRSPSIAAMTSHLAAALFVTAFLATPALAQPPAPSAAAPSAPAPAPVPPPLVKADAAKQVSPHVWVTPDDSVPLVSNIGYIIGSRATLVVDTGLGPRNGETVLAQARKLAPRNALYIITTHISSTNS